MKVLFIEYPKCTTCKRAKKWLTENGIDFEDRDIKENNPSKEELKGWLDKSGLEIKKFFNTSGVLYREQGMKDKVKTLSEDELLDILASDGMMVKRPIVVTESSVLVGFKETEWEEKLK
ncbi:arsenate reductase family protein [Clostridium thermobutyricum]|uniref:Regulatory protein MgsR n=1 Tax=Clostridium thermobutyricum DSM 4928 TaxID=1121339 RepID=A0A1V4STJ4_9CLOT|nr:arsenate reductase family protein [Clostridium thermobutyricum]OPX46776.1 regulatory protein MgsR [Clostridium thermobutyricum DSM 4928]